ncbi:MAG TPA: hypothetical protein PLM29_12550 [Deltaproteobacteria bacterium]|nr:hypothetical protein [Deltaproteobacteria bacterium]
MKRLMFFSLMNDLKENSARQRPRFQGSISMHADIQTYDKPG